MASINLPRFLQKLQSIVQEIPCKVGGWNSEGTEFEIRSDDFEKAHLPKYFKGSRSTFIRQLHFYGFKKLDNQGGNWAFSHAKFLRDSPHLIFEIRRKTRMEDSGPASKEEVQALRTEMEKMRNYISAMEEKMSTMQNDLHRVNQQLTGHKRSRPLSAEQGVLPFADSSSSSFDYKKAMEHGFESSDDEDDMKLTKKKKKSKTTPDYLDDVFGFDDDFTDLFLGLPVEDENKLSDEDPVTIFLKSRTHDIPMTNIMFADFLSGFVMQSKLLHQNNTLNREPDPVLEVFVYNSLPDNNPLKELLSNATTNVRAVLISVLQHADSTQMFPQNSVPAVPSALHFMHRPLVSFVTASGVATPVNGECFIQFLSFLLESAIEDDPKHPPPIPRFNSPFFHTFQQYFDEDVKRVMVRAKNSLEDFKRSCGGDNAACSSSNSCAVPLV